MHSSTLKQVHETTQERQNCCKIFQGQHYVARNGSKHHFIWWSAVERKSISSSCARKAVPIVDIFIDRQIDTIDFCIYTYGYLFTHIFIDVTWNAWGFWYYPIQSYWNNKIHQSVELSTFHSQECWRTNSPLSPWYSMPQKIPNPDNQDCWLQHQCSCKSLVCFYHHLLDVTSRQKAFPVPAFFTVGSRPWSFTLQKCCSTNALSH